MEYMPSFRDSLIHTMTDEEFDAKKFGLPKLKKYPMPDAAHVRSAIKFFNYVTPSNEAELARAIIARMEEYDISPDSMNIGDENRFKKYIKNTELKHHGILGQKWGVRRFQNPDGTRTNAGLMKEKVERQDEFKIGKIKIDKNKVKKGAKIAAGVLATGVAIYALHKTGTDRMLLEQGKKIAESITNKKLNSDKQIPTPPPLPTKSIQRASKNPFASGQYVPKSVLTKRPSDSTRAILEANQVAKAKMLYNSGQVHRTGANPFKGLTQLGLKPKTVDKVEHVFMNAMYDKQLRDIQRTEKARRYADALVTRLADRRIRRAKKGSEDIADVTRALINNNQRMIDRMR